MTRLREFLLITLGILAGAVPGFAAGLQWERETIAVIAPPNQRVVHVDFPFRNVGNKIVNIIAVETSCRCTSAYVARNSYAPGEKDVVGVDFVVGNRSGTVEKSVTVTTDGPEAKPVVLSLQVTIMPAASAKPAGT